MRGRSTRPIFFWLGILALTGLLASFALGSANLPELPLAPTATSRPLSAATPRTPGPVLSDSRGFIALAASDAAATVRRETDAAPAGSLSGEGFFGAVTGSGRRVAYWVSLKNGATQELRVFDTNAPDQQTPLTTVLAAERGAAAVWSADRIGLLLVVESSGRSGGGEDPGTFSALRVLDAPTRVIHEIARLSDGSQFWPVAWDRDSRLTGACITAADGSAVAYAVIGEDALSARIPMEAGIPARTVQSSGTLVLGVVNGAVIRVWGIASYTDHRELGASAGERIAFARWRTGGGDIVVSVADRLEIWPAQGGPHRVVTHGLPEATDLLVSTDGATAVVSFDGGMSAVAVDLETGRTAPVPMAGERLVAAVSFR